MSVRAVFGVVVAALAVLYFGGMVYYFTTVGGGVLDDPMSGLGPTIIGLGFFGLLAFAVLLFKVLKLFMPAPKTVVYTTSDRLQDAPTSDFDADAVMARYLERKATEGPPSDGAGAPAAAPPEFKGFGRRA